jgi:hypothetical protein
LACRAKRQKQQQQQQRDLQPASMSPPEQRRSWSVQRPAALQVGEPGHLAGPAPPAAPHCPPQQQRGGWGPKQPGAAAFEEEDIPLSLRRKQLKASQPQAQTAATAATPGSEVHRRPQQRGCAQVQQLQDAPGDRQDAAALAAPATLAQRCSSEASWQGDGTGSIQQVHQPSLPRPSGPARPAPQQQQPQQQPRFSGGGFSFPVACAPQAAAGARGSDTPQLSCGGVPAGDQPVGAALPRRRAAFVVADSQTPEWRPAGRQGAAPGGGPPSGGPPVPATTPADSEASPDWQPAAAAAAGRRRAVLSSQTPDWRPAVEACRPSRTVTCSTQGTGEAGGFCAYLSC